MSFALTATLQRGSSNRGLELGSDDRKPHSTRAPGRTSGWEVRFLFETVDTVWTPSQDEGMRAWPSDRIAFGGDYNPEQWPRARLGRRHAPHAGGRRQLRHPRGVLVVMARAVQGEYTFDWLDEIMDLLHEVRHRPSTSRRPRRRRRRGSPPRTPRSCPVDRDGHTPVAREPPGVVPLLAALPWGPWALALTDRPGRAVPTTTRPWRCGTSQTSTRCHNLPCYCDTCAIAFRHWLRAPLHHARRAQRCLGHRVLEPALHGEWDESCRQAHDDFNNPTHCSTTTGRLQHPARTSPGRARGHPPPRPRGTRHHELRELSHSGLDVDAWAPRWTSCAATTTSSAGCRTQ